MKNELAKPEATALAVASEVEDMFGGGHIQLPIDAPLPTIKLLRETPQFETPDGNTVKEIIGHIIYWHNANQYFDSEFGEGDLAPLCSSSDGIEPDGGREPLQGPCRGCEWNQYGSGKEGRGKACQNTIRLYILVDDEIIPCQIKAPPSCLGAKESLSKWLTNAPNVAFKAGVGRAYQPIKVRFTLHRKDFDSGFSASVLDLETVRVLDPETEMSEIKGLAALYHDFITHYKKRIADDISSESTAADDIPI